MVASEANASLPDVERADLDARLPRKRCSAGLLLFDPGGRILLVNPTYRDEWLLPGGVVEMGETPAEAATRELNEECGMVAVLQRLICVDMLAPGDGFSESVHFLFLATVADAQRDNAQPDGVEISALEWVDVNEAMRRLPQTSSTRLDSVIRGHSGYFERGLPHLACRGQTPSTLAP